MKSKIAGSKKKIHAHIRKHFPEGVKKVEKLFSFKYPKLFLLVFSVILAYYLFTRPFFAEQIASLNSLSYLGVFISGLFLSFGFSAPFSIGFFMTSHPNNILLATLTGGVGAAISDMIIFKTIKFSFMNEFNELKKNKIVKRIKKIVDMNIRLTIRHYFLYLFAGIMIVTPLPDEVGVSMLAGLTTIKPLKLALVSLVLHTLTIFFILKFGATI